VIQPTQTPPPHKWHWKRIALLLLALILLGFGSFSLISSKQATTPNISLNPTATSTPFVLSPTPDPTASWKTYMDMDGSLSFSYPNKYGDITKIINEQQDAYFRGPKSVQYNFSSFPGDKNFNNFNYIELVKKEDFISLVDKGCCKSYQDTYSFLNNVYSKKSVEGFSPPVRNGYFFGNNIAKKSKMTYVESKNGNIRGVSFFMRDGNGYGPNLQYVIAALDDKGNIITIRLFLWSNEQMKLQEELDKALKDSRDALSKWDNKMDDFLYIGASSVFLNQSKEVNQILSTFKFTAGKTEVSLNYSEGGISPSKNSLRVSLPEGWDEKGLSKKINDTTYIMSFQLNNEEFLQRGGADARNLTLLKTTASTKGTPIYIAKSDSNIYASSCPPTQNSACSFRFGNKLLFIMLYRWESASGGPGSLNFNDPNTDKLIDDFIKTLESSNI